MILDTNALSAYADRNLEVATLIDQAEQPVLSVITVAEFRYGLLGSKRPEAGLMVLEQLLIHLPLLSPDENTANEYAIIAHQLRKKGRPIPSNDIWIAALALQHQLPVLSKDKHFDFVDGIQRKSWG